MVQEQNEALDPDLVRSDWEGMAAKTPEFEEDKDLSEFLLRVKNEFWDSKSILDIGDAAISLVIKLGERGMEEFTPMVKRHFYEKTCRLHDRVLICNEEKLTGEGNDMSIAIARESLKEHLKWFLGEKEWDLLEKESNNRALLADKRDAGTSG